MILFQKNNNKFFYNFLFSIKIKHTPFIFYSTKSSSNIPKFIEFHYLNASILLDASPIGLHKTLTNTIGYRTIFINVRSLLSYTDSDIERWHLLFTSYLDPNTKYFITIIGRKQGISQNFYLFTSYPYTLNKASFNEFKSNLDPICGLIREFNTINHIIYKRNYINLDSVRIFFRPATDDSTINYIELKAVDFNSVAMNMLLSDDLYNNLDNTPIKCFNDIFSAYEQILFNIGLIFLQFNWVLRFLLLDLKGLCLLKSYDNIIKRSGMGLKLIKPSHFIKIGRRSFHSSSRTSANIYTELSSIIKNNPINYNTQTEIELFLKNRGTSSLPKEINGIDVGLYNKKVTETLAK